MSGESNLPADGIRNIDVYIAYAPRNEKMYRELKKYLKYITISGVKLVWLDGQILPGLVWEEEIKIRLDTAEVIIFLLSADSLDLLDTVTTTSLEMSKALERHKKNEASVVPVILRQCLWQNTPFKELQALPRDHKPIGQWKHRDEAYNKVAIEIQRAIENLIKRA